MAEHNNSHPRNELKPTITLSEKSSIFIIQNLSNHIKECLIDLDEVKGHDLERASELIEQCISIANSIRLLSDSDTHVDFDHSDDLGEVIVSYLSKQHRKGVDSVSKSMIVDVVRKTCEVKSSVVNRALDALSEAGMIKALSTPKRRDGRGGRLSVSYKINT